MTIDEMIEVLQAAKEGKAIQHRLAGRESNRWLASSGTFWDFNQLDYRVKPEPREWRVNIDTNTGGIVWGLPCGPAVVSGVHVREVLP